MDTDRQRLLEKIAELSEPLDPLRRGLAKYPFDWTEPPLLILTRRHLRSALARFVDGILVAADLEVWANILEVRDDIGYLPDEAPMLKEVLFELANPTISAALTKQRADELLSDLATMSPN
jgi:hypothetical protein